MKWWSSLCGALVLATTLWAAQDVSAQPPARTGPEFVFASMRERTLVESVRRRLGVSTPAPVRLEGTLTWKRTGESDRYGVTLGWPNDYQQRSGNTVHTLRGDQYRTNSGAPPALQEVAKENVRKAFGFMSLLLFVKPQEPGLRVSLAGTATVAGRPMRKIAVSNAAGPLLNLYVSASEDVLVAIGRPWALEDGQTERLDIVLERQRVGGMLLPVRVQQLIGKHESLIAVKASAGRAVTFD